MHFRRLLALFGTLIGVLFGLFFPTLITFAPVDCFSPCPPNPLDTILMLATFEMWFMALVGLIGFFMTYRNPELGQKVQSIAGYLSMVGGSIIVFSSFISQVFGSTMLFFLWLLMSPGMLFILSSRVIQQAR